jgi:hypothetical protein
MGRQRPGSAEENAAEHMRRFMREHRLTLTDMAGQVNSAAGRVIWGGDSCGKFRSGDRLLSLSEAVALARALGTTTDRLAQPPELAQAGPSNGFPLYARFAHPQAGYPAAVEHAAQHMEPGKVYQIRIMYVGQADSWLELAGVDGRWSTCMFEPAAP